MENANDQVMQDMLSWGRYITFSDDITYLYLAKTEKINEVKKKREANKKQDSDEDSDDFLDLNDVFMGHNIKPISI